MSSLNEENFYEIDEDDSDDEIEEVDMTDFEKNTNETSNERKLSNFLRM